METKNDMKQLTLSIFHLTGLPITLSLLTTPTQSPATTVRILSLQLQQKYAIKKGSEIWPECNESPIHLEASFPGGRIPQAARNLLDLTSENSTADQSPSGFTTSLSISSSKDGAVTLVTPSSLSYTMRGIKRRAVRTTLSHILRSAAQASTRRARSTSAISKVYGQTFGIPPPTISRGPFILALLLLVTNCVNLVDIVSVILLSIYIIGLASWCMAPTHASTTNDPIVNMPSFPRKGHVPALINNPLGVSLTNSPLYKTWLRVGAVLGILFPIMGLLQLTLRSSYPLPMNILDLDIQQVKKIVGGHTFLLCWQALSEAISRAALLPLPIRILIPVSYSTLRISSLRNWAFQTSDHIMPLSLRILGRLNLLFWYANLAFFLIPIGVTRYLRAHFYCVEAEEVTVRKGGDSSIGLLP